MYEHFAHGSLDVDFDQLISQAIREDRDVELDHGDERGFVVVIDGVALPNERDGFVRESFGYPITDVTVGRGEATELVNELVETVERSRTKQRNQTAKTDTHSAAEGVTESIEDSNT